MRLAPYQQGQSSIEGVSDPIKLSSNESSQGPSPMAIAAYQQAAAQLNRYPDGSQSELRTAIGETYGLDPQRIICGNGSGEHRNRIPRGRLYSGPREPVEIFH